MRTLGRKVILYMLVWLPAASVSFAAKAALNIAKGQRIMMDESRVHHGESESSRAFRPIKKSK